MPIYRPSPKKRKPSRFGPNFQAPKSFRAPTVPDLWPSTQRPNQPQSAKSPPNSKQQIDLPCCAAWPAPLVRVVGAS